MQFVFAAVKGDYGEKLIAALDCIILVNAPKTARSQRVRERSFHKFGDRILPGGDLYGCLAEGEYTLISEEKVDEFTLKQYTVDPTYDVVIGYSIQFKDKNRDLYHDDNQYWHTIRSELSTSEDNSFQFEVMDEEEHSAQSVEIPGMDKAVFINLGMNTRLIAIRTLSKPVVVKAKPGERLLGETTEYQYERIQLEGFTLEECVSFFQHE